MQSDDGFFGPEHEAFRAGVRQSIHREVIPYLLRARVRDRWRCRSRPGGPCPQAAVAARHVTLPGPANSLLPR
jgi:hypothetical protein